MISSILKQNQILSVSDEGRFTFREESVPGHFFPVEGIPNNSIVISLDMGGENFKQRPFIVEKELACIHCTADFILCQQVDDFTFKVFIFELKSGDTSGYYDQILGSYFSFALAQTVGRGSGSMKSPHWL